MTEFHTADLEQILDHCEKLRRENTSFIKWLASHDKGLKHIRIEQNEETEGWNNPEKSFSKLWRKDHSKHLQTLLSSQNRGMPNIKVTPKIRVAVATVIQWLGSNVGWCFLEMVLKEEGYKIVKIDETN